MKSLRIVFYILIVAFTFSCSSEKDKEIKMSRANWDTGYFHAEIYKTGLQLLGYKIDKLNDVKPSVFYVAAASGDVDLWTNGWETNQKTYIDEAKGKVIPVGYVANKEFLENNPRARKFLEIASIPVADISTQNFLMYKGEKSQKDIERHAQNWIKENQTKFDGWINEAIKLTK